MNLASILNLAPAAPGVPTSPEAAFTPATSLVAEFSALLDMAALPAGIADPAMPAAEGAASLAASTGKTLPDQGSPLPDLSAEDVVPSDPASLMALPSFLIITLPKQPEAPATAGLPDRAAPPAKSVVPEALLAMQASASPQSAAPASGGAAPAVATALLPAIASHPAASASPVPVAGPAAVQGVVVQFDLLAPATPIATAAVPPRSPQGEAAAPTAQQLAAMPVVQAIDPRRDQAGRSVAPPMPAIPAAAKESEPQAAAPVAPALAPMVLAPATNAAAISEPMRLGQAEAPAATSAATPATTPAAARHDFAAVVDRLTEARELAQPGRATMQLAHREFGAINVQFDMAGQSLKVGLASSDAAFAPAVQAALTAQAERPVIASGEAQGSRSDQQRSDQPLPATPSSSTPASQGDGQARDQQARGAQARQPSDQVQRQPQDSGERHENPAASSRARDGSLFA